MASTTDEPVINYIPEQRHPDRPLGRHQYHHPASRAYRAPVQGVEPKAKVWKRLTHPFNQSRYYVGGMRGYISLGSCTGNGIVGMAATEPFRKPGFRYTERLAVKVYTGATEIDPFEGSYPPDDTGSDGLSACKIAVKLGLATGYQWGFGLGDMIRIISGIGPVAVGTDWVAGFDEPDGQGVVNLSGETRGGHEYEVIGYHPDTSLGAPIADVFECVQSWGNWGVRGTQGGYGRFFVRVPHMGELLNRGGDVVTLTV